MGLWPVESDIKLWDSIVLYALQSSLGCTYWVIQCPSQVCDQESQVPCLWREPMASFCFCRLLSVDHRQIFYPQGANYKRCGETFSLPWPFYSSRYSISVASLKLLWAHPQQQTYPSVTHSHCFLVERRGKGTMLCSSMEEWPATFLSFWDRNCWLNDLWGLFLHVHSIFSQGFSVGKSFWP